MKFDAKKIRLMANGDSAGIDGFPGLRMAASATRRTWIYRYRSPVDNSLKQIKLGEWPALSYSAAIAAWESARTVRDSGVDAAAAKRAEARKEPEIEPERYTVATLCKEYLIGHIERHRGNKGADNARLLLTAGIKPIAEIEPQAITRKQAFALIEARSATPVSAAKLRAELGAAWEYAIDAGRLPDDTPNWWRQILRGRLKSSGRVRAGERTKEKRILSDRELTLLLGWLPFSIPILHDVCVMYLWTGTRGAEVMGMRGSEIARERDGVMWWTIPKARTKNAKVDGATDLRVPLIGRALTVVTERLNKYGNGYLFPGQRPRTHKTQKAMGEMLARFQPYSKVSNSEVYPEMPVTHWALHDLRRTTRTNLARFGCERDVAESIIGHVLPGVEGIYNLHKYDNERREWLARIDAHLEECASAGLVVEQH